MYNLVSGGGFAILFSETAQQVTRRSVNSNRSFAHSSVILIGVILTGVCLLIILALSVSGLAFWRILPGAASSTPIIPIQATPIQPAPATTVPPAETAPMLVASATLPAQTEAVVTDAGAGDVFFKTATVPEDMPGETQAAALVTAVPGGEPTTAVVFPVVAIDQSCIPMNRASRRVRVTEVIDAVTIEVDDGGEIYRISYIGADLPENAQDPAVWSAAREYHRELVEGQMVLAITDRTEQNAVGYRPRYVLAGNVFVNLEMIAAGYARAAAQPPDLSCQELFQDAQQRANAAQVGLLAPSPTTTRILILPPTPTIAVTGPMRVSALARRGTLWQEPEEWVEIRNDSEQTIQLEGWTIQDNERHIFTFPAFRLGPGQYCRVYTNEYHPNSCGFYYGSRSPIWNNDVDCAYLKDPYGQLISTFCYGYP